MRTVIPPLLTEDDLTALSTVPEPPAPPGGAAPAGVPAGQPGAGAEPGGDGWDEAALAPLWSWR